jgi:catechol 2,3-dioxygenase-like lactoylglutathione lyase family enzyme
MTGTAVMVGAVALVVSFVAGLRSDKTLQRPKIYGISGVQILSSNVPAANLFYGRLVELNGPCNWCENNPYKLLEFPSGQIIGVSPNPKTPPKDRLASITLAVDNEKLLRHWLDANKIPYKESAGPYFDRTSYVMVLDPEGHKIYFHAVAKDDRTNYAHLPIIHAGFVVKDRAVMDKFYAEVLAFHVYWHGGMKDGQTDWVDMQVPDGTDWIEYMLNVPENADKHTLGVMNHIALGVPDVRAAAEELDAHGVKLPEQPQIGRDGKWQLNLYDPDDTRVELMEFAPTEKPCCAEYTGPHPKP